MKWLARAVGTPKVKPVRRKPTPSRSTFGGITMDEATRNPAENTRRFARASTVSVEQDAVAAIARGALVPPEQVGHVDGRCSCAQCQVAAETDGGPFAFTREGDLIGPRVDPYTVACTKCAGTGKRGESDFVVHPTNPMLDHWESKPCRRCDGTGRKVPRR